MRLDLHDYIREFLLVAHGEIVVLFGPDAVPIAQQRFNLLLGILLGCALGLVLGIVNGLIVSFGRVPAIVATLGISGISQLSLVMTKIESIRDVLEVHRQVA